jgi:hypothetical protein
MDPGKALKDMLDMILPPQIASDEKNEASALISWQAYLDARIACTVADDSHDKDFFFKTRKASHFYSLSYYKKDTIDLILTELKQPLCAFHYDVLLKDVGISLTCQHS